MDDSQWMPPDPSRGAGAPQPVPETAQPSLPPPSAGPNIPPPPSSPAGGAAWPPADAGADLPTVDPADRPTPSRPRRSKLLVGGGVAAVLAVGAAGVFAVQQYSDSSEGGAASPSELGTELLTAIEQEDVLGMVDTLLPGERDVMRQPLIDLVSELARLDVLSDDADLSSIGGTDVELSGETVTPNATNVDDIVNVEMYADATVTADGATVPVGELITDNMDPDDVTEMRETNETETEVLEFALTAVEDDGRWYFSLFHSAAEEARQSIAGSPDIPASGVGAIGGDSPEAGFNQLLDSAVALDLEKVIQALNPGEAAALQRYAPLFLDDAEAAIGELPPHEITIDSRELRVEGDGDTRTVFVDALAVSGFIGEQGDQVRFSASFDGDCVTASAEGDNMERQEIEQCTDDVGEVRAQLDEMLDDAPAVAEFLTALEEAFADIEPVGIEVRQTDGSWYVSPITTGTEAVLKFLRALDRQEIDRLIELGTAGAEEFFDLALGGMFGVDEFATDDFGDLLDESAIAADTDVSTVEVTVEESSDEMTTSDDQSEQAASSVDTSWDECYMESDADDAIACFQRYVASGEIDATYVPIALRFPECGYAEVSWSGALYSMADAEFIAAADAARPCFQALLAAGTVDEYELPYEITKPECFEGRNWYATYDDQAYLDRFQACISGQPTPTTAPG